MAKDRQPKKDAPRLIERAIKAYVALRDEKARLKKEYDEQVESIEAKMEKIEQVLKEHMDKAGLESVRSAAGTAFKTYKEYVSVESWDSTLDFIIKNEAWHFLKRDVVKAAVKEYMEENGSLPPGVRYERELEIQVRRPS